MPTIRNNLSINANTQYSNHEYNSYLVFNGQVIGLGDDGIYKCGCGESDDGEEIDAYFSPHTSKLGSDNQKRMRFVYYGGKSDGEISVEVTGDGGTPSGPYVVSFDQTKTYQERRVSIGRGNPANYIKLKFANVDGSSFSFDKIKAYIYALGHGRK